MSDKFRKVFPIAVVFADGDQPPAGKLNAVASQARNGLALIEKAVGDIWNQSGDNNLIPSGDLFKNALYVSNIGRALGQQSFVSPRVHSLPNIEQYFDTIVVGSTAKPEAWLRYKPVPAGGALASGDFTVGTVVPAGAVVLGQFKTAADLVAIAGDWHVTPNGKLFTFTPIQSLELTYKPLPVPDVDTVAQSNVIPDPFTDTGLGTQFNGLKIAYANDSNNSAGFWIYLPPRRPLISDRKIAQSPNHTGNQANPVGTRYYFQDLTATAATGTNGIHYRYKFPDEVQDLIDAAIAVGIPDNFLYLMDTDTGTIVEGLTFSVDPSAPKYAIKATGTKLNEIITDDVTLVSTQANEASSAYKSRFKIIGPGTSLARAYAGLSKLYFNHQHIGADGSLPLSHSQLVDLYNSNSPNWEPSALKGDDHPQYLHRDGYTPTRDALANGLRGHLLLLASDNTVGVGVDSYGVYFGNTTNKLYYNQANDAIAVATGADFRLDTASQKVQFGSTTQYLDQTRVKALWDAMNMVKTYRAVINASGNIQASPYNLDIVIPAAPSGLQYYVHAIAAFDIIQTEDASGGYLFNIQGTGINSVIPRTIETVSGDFTCASAAAQGGPLSASTTVRFVIQASNVTNTIGVSGDFIVTVHPYVP